VMAPCDSDPFGKAVNSAVASVSPSPGGEGRGEGGPSPKLEMVNFQTKNGNPAFVSLRLFFNCGFQVESQPD